jgi:hypothetical protein
MGARMGLRCDACRTASADLHSIEVNARRTTSMAIEHNRLRA